MDDVYPPGPPAVPQDLTRPTVAYRRHAWIALGGLVAFVLLYFALSGWLARNAWRNLYGVFTGSAEGELPLALGAGVASLVLALFLVKGLFAIRRGELPKSIEVTEADQPRLFAFLRRLADETGAPHPHRVFLSAGVNACVFYDLSLLNLVLPTRKNLDVGLGLVNVLTMSELKAVLAHEFGHFAQRSMYVGRWVYIARQVVGHLVATRDWFDRALQFLSGIDLRVAWIGWLLRLFTWSVRSLLDTAFSLTLLAERALSREMEFQADIVAVSVTGSDALVHALHRLEAADTAFDEALNVTLKLANRGRRPGDLYALQTAVTDELRRILGDADFGRVPPLPSTEREAHRIFEEALAVPPRMWSTHPGNRQREDNAKSRYTPAPLDDRSAWCLFTDAVATRREATTMVVSQLETERELEVASDEEARDALGEYFKSVSLEERYRGCYLGRSPAIGCRRPDDMYDEFPESGGLREALARLYPPSLAELLETVRKLEQEHASLEALRDGILSAPGGVIRHRGQSLKRRQLPRAIAEVDAERRRARAEIWRHDRQVRTAHLAAAEQLGDGWPEYLRGLGRVLHYVTHTVADLGDARGALANVFAIVIADGAVSKAERTRLVAAATDLFLVLQRIHEQKGQLRLPELATAALEVPSWGEALEDLGLALPSPENIGDWLQVVDSWADAYLGSLAVARGRTLEALLQAEDRVAEAFLAGEGLGPAPTAPVAPESYATQVPGEERERQRQLGLWDRFMTADGFFPAALRLAVAVVILGSVLGFGARVGSAHVIVYNGLDAPVQVTIGERVVELWSDQHADVPLDARRSIPVVARAASGTVIESFTASADEGMGTYVYNVAAASPLVHWTASYGSAAERPPRALGAVRWQKIRADYYFADPPENLSTRSGGTTRSVLTGFAGKPPDVQLTALPDGAPSESLVAVHARWATLDSPWASQWLGLAQDLPEFSSLLEERLSEQPLSVALLRLELDAAGETRRETVCSRHRQVLAAHPNSADLQYVVTRCEPDEAQRDGAFITGFQDHPDNGWFAYAAGASQASRGQYVEALAALQVARRHRPARQADAALLFARLARLEPEGADTPPWQELRSQSRQLDVLLSLERGDGVEGPALAYHHLGAGRLDAALHAVATSPLEPRVLRLVAASDGADAATVARAFELPPDAGIDPVTVWAALGLAAREHRDLDAWLARAREIAGPYAAALLEPLRATAAPGAPVAAAATSPPDGAPSAAAVESLPMLLPVELQAQYCVLGLVRKDPRTPAVCRSLVRGVLFANERPYFRE